MNIKQLLLKQTYEAYAGDLEVSLVAALEDLTPGEAACNETDNTSKRRTIIQLFKSDLYLSFTLN